MIILWLGLIASVGSVAEAIRFRPPYGKQPIDCVVTYTVWSECSVPCGPGGVEARWGRISRPAQNGGKPCGELEQERPCQNQPACDEPVPVDCQVWFGEWSLCSRNCGGGFRTRRGIIEFRAKNGGEPCPELDQKESCNEHNCDMPKQDCKVEYAAWSQCSKSCGGGYKWRRGRIVVPPRYGGYRCPPLEQEVMCNDHECDEPNRDCKIQYGEWGECSKPCGGGIQYKRAVIVVSGSGNGLQCPEPGDLEERRECNTHGCTGPSVDCKLSCEIVEYYDWTPCSKDCGGGVTQRWGKIVRGPINGGAPCPPLEQEEKCNQQLCDIAVVDCEVIYNAWTECSVPCGGGKQQRWGRIVAEPSNGGAICPELEQEQNCNEDPCRVPIDCEVWYPEWSACSKSCGGGFRWRRGLIEVEPKNGGEPCPDVEQEEPCNQEKCPTEDRDCKVRFGDWGDCSQPCGRGYQWRKGVIVQTARGNGKQCPPPEQLEEERACNDFECEPNEPIDCEVTYTPWTRCSRTCGGGVIRRWGKIAQEARNGGAPCTELEQEKYCNEHPCPLPIVDCQVVYTAWTECSATCGGGVRLRWGKVLEKPQNGGATCPPLEDEHPCNEDVNCAPPVIDCFIQYTGWSECSDPCGGTRLRWGRVVVEASAGGAPCGSLEEEEKCEDKDNCEPPLYGLKQRFRRRTNKPYVPRRRYPQIPRPKPVPDCTKLSNGNHQNPRKKCSNTFISCTNGGTKERTCPEKMFYDKEEDHCDIYAYVPACSGKRRPPTTTLPPQIPPKRKPDPEFDCTRLPDAEYPDKFKCSRKWFSCLKGYTTKLTCSNDMYYDVETKSCQQWIDVFACSGKRPKKTTPVIRDLTTRKPVPVDCNNLPDGLHPNPKIKCSNRYYSCSNGIGESFTCPGDLYFSPVDKICDAFSNIYVCTGRVPVKTRPTPKPTTVRPIVYPFNCKGKTDGMYPAGRCEPFYWTCSGGATNKIVCSKNLFYDVQNRVCDQRTYIVKCGGKPRTTVALLPTSTPKPVNFDCTRRENKNYPAGKCKNFYYSCSGTVPRKMDCSAATFYDDEFDICDEPKYIPKCGGKRRPKTTKVPAIPTVKPYRPIKRYGPKPFSLPRKFRLPLPKKPVRPRPPPGFYGRQ